jgi:hypothetical protein
MTETAKARAARLMEEVGSGSQERYSRGEVKTILNAVAQSPDAAASEPKNGDEDCRAPASLDELRRGDVFIAKLVGGKVRPWVVLQTNDDVVTAVALSSGDSAPNMTRSECRYWPASWIGSTISQFSIEAAQREVTRPYTNLAHLRAVERQIYSRMGAVLVGPTSIAEIREKIPA